MRLTSKHQSSIFLLKGILLGAILSHQALAQDSAGAQITITGTAPAICILPNPVASGTATNATFASNAIALTQLVDPNTSLLNPSAITIQFPNTLCNFNATVTLSSKSGGMVPTNAMPVIGGSEGFIQNVPYTVTANWGTFSLVLDTSGSNGSPLTVSKLVGGANAANMSLTFVTQKSSSFVGQGSYQDTLTIKIGAPM